MASSLLDPTVRWLYIAVGAYAVFVLVVVFYNFRVSPHPPRRRRRLEIATVLMALGMVLAGGWRLGVVEIDEAIILSGVMVLLAQMVVLYVIYGAYHGISGMGDDGHLVG